MKFEMIVDKNIEYWNWESLTSFKFMFLLKILSYIIK